MYKDDNKIIKTDSISTTKGPGFWREQPILFAFAYDFLSYLKITIILNSLNLRIFVEDFRIDNFESGLIVLCMEFKKSVFQFVLICLKWY